MQSYQQMLLQHPFVSGLTESQVQLLTGLSSLMVFRAGDFIFRQGEPADHFYLIVKGKVSIEAFSAAGGPVVLQDLGNHEIVGWSWLVPPYQWRFDARTVQPTTTIALDAKRLRLEMEKDPIFSSALLHRFLIVQSQRLEAALFRLADVYAAHS